MHAEMLWWLCAIGLQWSGSTYEITGENDVIMDPPRCIHPLPIECMYQSMRDFKKFEPCVTAVKARENRCNTLQWSFVLHDNFTSCGVSDREDAPTRTAETNTRKKLHAGSTRKADQGEHTKCTKNLWHGPAFGGIVIPPIPGGDKAVMKAQAHFFTKEHHDCKNALVGVSTVPGVNTETPVMHCTETDWLNASRFDSCWDGNGAAVCINWDLPFPPDGRAIMGVRAPNSNCWHLGAVEAPIVVTAILRGAAVPAIAASFVLLNCLLLFI